MKIISDTHMHTTFSFDGKDSAADMAEAAYRRGMKYICFTEHHNENPDFHKVIQYDEYIETIAALKEAYKGRMTVLCGVEYDQPESYPERLRELQNEQLDMIMGSVHNVFGEYAGCDVPFGMYTPEQIMREHYRLTVIAAQQGMIDVIGHFDLPIRCSPDPDIDLREERLAALRAIAENGIAIELNVGSMRSRYGNSLPSQKVLREFAEVGGKRVLFGSDAHCTADVCIPFEKIENYDLCGLVPGVFINREFVPIYAM